MKNTLSWDHSGIVDGFLIYKSTSQILLTDLPEPIAIVTMKNYEDTDIIIDTEYFYRIGAKRGDALQVSDQVSVITSKTPYLVDLKVSNGQMVDSGSLASTWTKTGLVSIVGDYIDFPIQSSTPSYISANVPFNFGQNYRIEFEFMRYASTTGDDTLFSSTNTTGSPKPGSAFIQVPGNGAFSTYQNRVRLKGEYDHLVPQFVSSGVYYILEIKKTGLLVEYYLNGNLVLTQTITNDENTSSNVSNSPIYLGYNFINAMNSQFKGRVKSLKMYDLT